MKIKRKREEMQENADCSELFTLWLQTQMMTTTGLQRGLELISGLLLCQEAMMTMMECKVHLEDHSGDTQERMCP